MSRAELCKAELELEINKTKAEEASLRDALLKMQALNEGLGQDKIELNKIILQVIGVFIVLSLDVQFYVNFMRSMSLSSR